MCKPTTSSVEQPPAETTSHSAQDSLQDFLNRYYETMSSRNWSAYRDFFWGNATLTTVWQTPESEKPAVMVTTIGDFIRQTPQGPDSQPIFEELMTGKPEIKRSGNLATAWSTYKAKFGTEDDLMRWTGTDVFTLMRHEGQWKIVSLVYE